MRTEVINVDTIEAAAERILEELKEDTNGTSGIISSKVNVIYFDGWEGLGASAVLQAVGKLLAVASKAPDGLQFDQIIHIDCSKWESMRVFQRVIAVQLDLPAEVMELFGRQDEEDDFNGVDQGSRGVIEEVLGAMHRRIKELNHRFLVIFHNGGSKEIDMASFGFPLSKYFGNKVLWTFQGRFRLHPRMKVDDAIMNKMSPESTTTDVFLLASLLEKRPQELRSYLVGKEAAEVALLSSCQPSQVAKYLSYIWSICCMGQHFRVDYDLATYGCSYWVCDSTIHDDHDVDGSWRKADALQREMRLDVNYYNHSHDPLPSQLITMSYWTSPAYGVLGALLIPVRETLQHFNKLCVLKLSHCTLSFSSPPFVCCHNLRFLWLDHCEDQDQLMTTDEEGTEEENCQEDQAMINADEAGKIEEEEDIGRCFQRLWVLDVRYTRCDRILSAEMMALLSQLRELNVMGAQDWDMGQLILGRLSNIRKLRVTKSTINSLSENGDLFLGMMKKMELLEFSGNRIIRMKSLTMAANNISLLVETIIIDEGCVGLKEVSFRGCPKLKNILLRGLFQELRSIDISGTAVKTLDVSAMVAPSLDEFVALGCDKLCAVLWPPKGKMKEYLRKLYTTNAATSSLSVKYGSGAPTEYDWYVSVKDARLLRSLVPFEDYFNEKYVHMEVSSAPDVGGGSKEEESMIIKSGCQLEMDNASVYEGVAVTLKLQQEIWPCPGAPMLDERHCYMYIQDPPHQPKLLPGERAAASTSSCSITVPDRICHNARILHVYDSKFITCVPGPLQGSTWRCLEWCRVERCPSLDCVFFMGSQGPRIFSYLETLWASQLPRARCIWNLSSVHRGSFEDLKFMHVDLCPRLTHVLHWPTRYILGRLETIEIVWCGDLKAIFPTPLDNAEKSQEDVVIEFPALKRIHLHELPMLHDICGRGRTISAPNLESIKIRGCWSLTRLPAVDNQVECDCEKEWWHNLKWDEEVKEEYYNYKPTHPRHYKNTFLRTSVLR